MTADAAGDDAEPGPDEPELSTAVRVASAIGLFLGGAVAAPAALILLAYGFDAVGAEGGWVIYADFAIVTVATLAALVPARWRPFGIGAAVGVLFAGALASFYLIVLQAGGDDEDEGLRLRLGDRSPPAMVSLNADRR